MILTEISGKTIFVDIGSHLRDEAGVGCWIDIKFFWSLIDIFESRIILGKQYLRKVGSVTIDFDRMQLGIENPIKPEDASHASVFSTLMITCITVGSICVAALIAFIVWRIIKDRRLKLRNELWMYEKVEQD